MGYKMRHKLLQLLYAIGITILLFLIYMQFSDLHREANAASSAKPGRRFRSVALGLPTSGTEYSQDLDLNDRPIAQFQVKSRNNSDIYISWASGGDTTTLKGGDIYFENELNFIGTIYLTGTANNDTADFIIVD